MNAGAMGFPRPPESSPLHRRSGLRYFVGGSAAIPGTNGTIPVGTLYASCIEIGPRPMRFKGIAFTNLGVASSFIRLGLYQDAEWGIGDCIMDSGQIDTAAFGEKFYPYPFEAVDYIWVAGVGQSVAPSVTRMGLCYNKKIGSSDVYSVAFGGMAYSQTGVTGALPRTWGNTAAAYTIVSAANVAPFLHLVKDK